jgi:hypothetical protein
VACAILRALLVLLPLIENIQSTKVITTRFKELLNVRNHRFFKRMLIAPLSIQPKDLPGAVLFIQTCSVIGVTIKLSTPDLGLYVI